MFRLQADGLLSRNWLRRASGLIAEILLDFGAHYLLPVHLGEHVGTALAALAGDQHAENEKAENGRSKPELTKLALIKAQFFPPAPGCGLERETGFYLT